MLLIVASSRAIIRVLTILKLQSLKIIIKKLMSGASRYVLVFPLATGNLDCREGLKL